MGEITEEVSASVSPDEAAKQGAEERKRSPPLLAAKLVRKATNAHSSIGIEELCKRIYGGVLVKDNKQKFWVDKDFGKNCFLLLAKGLFIAWIDDEQYWHWINDAEKCFSGEVDLPAAMLFRVSWLEISGTFRTIKLSPKTTYEVAYVVKMSEDSEGWDTPVTLKLTLPDGTSLGRMENLNGKQKGQWMDIPVGTFVTTPENVGEISFHFSERSAPWKYGLTVKGVTLRPKD